LEEAITAAEEPEIPEPEIPEPEIPEPEMPMPMPLPGKKKVSGPKIDWSKIDSDVSRDIVSGFVDEEELGTAAIFGLQGDWMTSTWKKAANEFWQDGVLPDGTTGTSIGTFKDNGGLSRGNSLPSGGIGNKYGNLGKSGAIGPGGERNSGDLKAGVGVGELQRLPSLIEIEDDEYADDFEDMDEVEGEVELPAMSGGTREMLEAMSPEENVSQQAELVAVLQNLFLDDEDGEEEDQGYTDQVTVDSQFGQCKTSYNTDPNPNAIITVTLTLTHMSEVSTCLLLSRMPQRRLTSTITTKTAKIMRLVERVCWSRPDARLQRSVM